MIKHYVEFLYPGIFFPESSTKEITEEKPFNGKFPKGCYCYSFFDVEEVEGEHGKLCGNAFNKSGRYYRGGQVYTTEELEELFPEERILISNCRNNGGRVVKTKIGNWQPFTDKDTLVIE